MTIWIAFVCGVPVIANETGRNSPLLRRAFEFADLNNWADAEPEFGKAATVFHRNGDRTGLEYAELGIIRATIQRRNLALTSAQLQKRLDSDPLMKTDRDLRIFCLAIKGGIDGEMGAAAMRRDWEEVGRLARYSSDPRWQYRAMAELGMAAFYEGDLQTARKNISEALIAATDAHDVGSQVKYLYAIGVGLNQSRMNTDAIGYLDKAIALSNATPGAPYPFAAHLAKAEALVSMGQIHEADNIARVVLENARRRKADLYEVLALFVAARVDRAQGNAAQAIDDLNRAIGISERDGYAHALIESRTALANIYGARGDVQKAEALLAIATAASQRNGELYTLPQRLQTLADLQAREGKFAEADKTYDRAAAFVDAGIGNDSVVLDKTAWIKSASDLYVAHFRLLAEHMNNPAKAYAVVEQVRGRVMTDLLMGGSKTSERAEQNERTISRLRLQLMNATSIQDVQKIRDQIFLLEQSRWITPDMSILKSRSYSRVTLHDVQRTLDSRAAILEYVLDEPTSWCLIISRNSLNIARLAGKNEIETYVSAYLNSIKQKQAAQTESRRLYDLVLRPVDASTEMRDLLIIRDGVLNLVPFDALRDASGRFAGERTTISYLPSSSSFYLLAQQVDNAEPGRRKCCNP